MLAGRGRGGHRRLVRLRGNSPLRRMDARVKVALTLLISAAAMLPLPRLLVFAAGFVAFMAYARLLSEIAYQVRRLAWMLIVLFALDWAFIGLDFAILITFRIVLVVSCSTLLLATTTPEEFRQALLTLGVPYRYAFVLSLAFQSVPLMTAELRNIREAQQARGALPQRRGWQQWLAQSWDMVALAVPAVVLTARRAWALTEAAHARGLDTPHRTSARPRGIRWHDWVLVAVTMGSMIALTFCH